MLDKPPWLDEQPNIKTFLITVLKKYESKNTLKFKITKKILPELYGSAETADTTWFLLNELCTKKFKIFEFKNKGVQNTLDYNHLNGILHFQTDSEDMLRSWLKLPSQKALLESWQSLIENKKSMFTGDSRCLSDKLVVIKGKTQDNIVSGFIQIRMYLDDGLTLRNLSAKCFWGNSKFLDNKIDLIKSLYPELKLTIRPVVVNVYLPEKIEGILFIENQDSYTQGIKGKAGIAQQMKNLALIFSYGNKLSAKRVRSHSGVSFHFDDNSNFTMKEEFKQFWYNEVISEWPSYFWGDLDFSGMDMLANLKQSFKSIEAWQAGYQPMLDLILQGIGHSPELMTKQRQNDPGKTGCQYADEKLLPALRITTSVLFIDQEWLV